MFYAPSLYKYIKFTFLNKSTCKLVGMMFFKKKFLTRKFDPRITRHLPCHIDTVSAYIQYNENNFPHNDPIRH